MRGGASERATDRIRGIGIDWLKSSGLSLNDRCILMGLRSSSFSHASSDFACSARKRPGKGLYRRCRHVRRTRKLTHTPASGNREYFHALSRTASGRRTVASLWNQCRRFLRPARRSVPSARQRWRRCATGRSVTRCRFERPVGSDRVRRMRDWGNHHASIRRASQHNERAGAVVLPAVAGSEAVALFKYTVRSALQGTAVQLSA